MSDDRPLAALLASAEPLTVDERRTIVVQARLLMEQLYVHLPFKRAMHAVDPVQRLRLLEHRLERLPERGFHEEMRSIFIGLRDLHTNYILPAPFRGAAAVLPFRIEACCEGGERRYLVSSVAAELGDVGFEPGVEVTHWNGIPIDVAVDLNADRNAGSNSDARHARGLISMTHRPIDLLGPPYEEWVDIAFLGLGGEPQEISLEWQVLRPSATPAAGAAAPTGRVAMALGVDILVESVRRAQKTTLAPGAMRLERAAAAGGEAPDLTTVSVMPDVLEFRTVAGPRDDVGYLRIRTFLVWDVDAFLAEVMRILDLLPAHGLIIDVRANGGGVITAGERLLQLFTPRRIEPERLHFLNSELTGELTTLDGLQEWHTSIDASVETGSAFSDGFPVFAEHENDCNSIGQYYFGPVALVVDALCYSTTDVFAAGFQDHEIGPVLGADGNTGAGGANVWDHDLLGRLLPDRFPPLPREAFMRVAIRRTTRVGKRAGDPVEDLGVVPDHVHRMTRRDLLEGNADLIQEAATLLTELPARGLSVEVDEDGGVAVRTSNLDRIDVYLDERPVATIDVSDGDHPTGVRVDGAPSTVEVRGFSQRRCVARRSVTA